MLELINIQGYVLPCADDVRNRFTRITRHKKIQNNIRKKKRNKKNMEERKKETKNPYKRKISKWEVN